MREIRALLPGMREAAHFIILLLMEGPEWIGREQSLIYLGMYSFAGMKALAWMAFIWN